MTLLQSIIMGVIQGVAEFLPISSSGHLAIFKSLFGMKEVGLSFDILLHVGTLVAIFVVYYKDIIRLIVEGIGICVDAVKNVCIFVTNKTGKGNKEYIKIVSDSYRKFVMLVIVSTIPTAIIGVLAKDVIEAASMTLIVPGICLLLTGCILLLGEKAGLGKKTPKNVTYTNAFVIGICQGFATLPGISRSGTTISACLVSGFDRKFAVKYSFIMSIPAVLGAAVLDLKDIGSEHLTGAEWTNYIIGAVVAAVVGYICIKTMLVLVRDKKFKYFAYYCFAMGAVAIIANFLI